MSQAPENKTRSHRKADVNRVRIAVTGIGLVTPLGTETESTWEALQRGDSAARFLTEEEIGSNQIPARVRGYGARVELNNPGLHDSRSTIFALMAARQAIAQAQLSPEFQRSAGCVFGTSKTDLRATDDLFAKLHEDRTGQTEPAISALFPSSPSTAVANEFQLQGPASCPVAACATGMVSLIRAAELIRHGDASTVITGSTDCSLHAGLLASYRRLGVLAKPEDDPAQACRPFDQHRGGFVVGEGAAALVLEDWDQANERGAAPLAEWVDGLIGCDPTGLTAVDSTGETLAQLIQKLLDQNQVHPRQVSTICYHGTATRMNDLTEARAIQLVFGDRPTGFGIKGAIGHLMGAAGAVEAATSVCAIKDQIIPPTANHHHHDPECPNRVTGRHAVRQPIEYLLKTSLGFGGHLAVGLLKRVTN